MRARAAIGSLALLIQATSLAAQDQPEIRIARIDLGMPTVGSSTLRAEITNPNDTAYFAVLDVRTEPGLWLLRNLQSQFGYELGPHETRTIEAEYSFQRMSPEAQIRIRLGPGHRSEQGYLIQDSVVFERRYSVGEGNPAALDLAKTFAIARRGPLEIYAWKGSLAAERLETIARDRLAAMEAIGQILDVEPPKRVLLVFYPDSTSKTSQTGHIGVGMARGNMIVEIYNDEIQLNPYHELAHVVAAEVGEAPAMLNEGFATYVSERLESDALEQLGSPGLSVDDASCRFLRGGTAFSLQELSALDEIGSPESRPTISYPQSASVVKFLVETHGVERFREIYRAAARSSGSAADRIASAFDRVLGTSIADVEAAWRASVEAACR